MGMVERMMRGSRKRLKKAMKTSIHYNRRRGTYPTVQDAAEGTGRFSMAGRRDPYRSPAPAIGGGKPGKKEMVPSYVSDADIAGFSTSEKMRHEGMRKRVVRLDQAGMGPTHPQTKRPTKGAVWQRW